MSCLSRRFLPGQQNSRAEGREPGAHCAAATCGGSGPLQWEAPSHRWLVAVPWARPAWPDAYLCGKARGTGKVSCLCVSCQQRPLLALSLATAVFWQKVPHVGAGGSRCRACCCHGLCGLGQVIWAPHFCRGFSRLGRMLQVRLCAGVEAALRSTGGGSDTQDELTVQ